VSGYNGEKPEHKGVTPMVKRATGLNGLGRGAGVQEVLKIAQIAVHLWGRTKLERGPAWGGAKKGLSLNISLCVGGLGIRSDFMDSLLGRPFCRVRARSQEGRNPALQWNEKNNNYGRKGRRSCRKVRAS